jgi:hypothetical protein
MFFISEATDDLPSVARAIANSLIHVAQSPVEFFLSILYLCQAFRKFSWMSEIDSRDVSVMSASLSFHWRYLVCTKPPDFFFSKSFHARIFFPAKQSLGEYGTAPMRSFRQRCCALWVAWMRIMSSQLYSLIWVRDIFSLISFSNFFI